MQFEKHIIAIPFLKLQFQMQLFQMKFPNAIPKTEQLQFQILNYIIAILQMQLIQMKFPNAIPKTD